MRPDQADTTPAASAPPAASGALASLSVAILLALALPAAAAAQEPPPADSVVKLPDVVVTATRLPTPREAVPAPVSVVTGDELRERGVRHLGDALAGLPGLSVVETGSFGGRVSVFLRGGESDHVRVLVDGVPINEPGGAVDLAGLTTDNIERIEVVRGPASVLYGSDAVSGVIQVFTRRGEGAPELSARARGGSYGTGDVAAALRGDAGPAAYSISLGHFRSDGLLEVNNQHRSTTFSGSVRVLPDARSEATLSVRRTDQVFHYPTDGAGRIVDANAYQFGEATTLSLEAARRFGSLFEARLLLGSHSHHGGIDDDFDDDGDPNALRTLDDVRRRSADLNGTLRLGRGTALTLGGLLEESSIRRFLASESSFGPFGYQLADARANRALYLQALARPVERVSLTGGVRMEDNASFGRFATYRAGAVLTLAPGLRARAVVGTGFKEPTFLESFGGGFVRGNPDLEPERSTSRELGLEWTLADGRLRLSGGWFHQDFTNLIDYTAAVEEGEPNYFNVVGAEAAGVELEAAARLGAGVTLTTSYTYLDTRVVDPGFDATADAAFAPGDRLLRRPTHSASILARYSRGAGAWSAGARYTGARMDQDFSDWPAVRSELPGFTVVDVSGEYPPLRGRSGLVATARVENVLDTEYQNPIGFPGRGRTLLLGVRTELVF